MKSFYLFLVFASSAVSVVFSQKDANLKTFSDYSNCNYGLKSTSGQTIWTAQFESLQQINDGHYDEYPRNYFWLAQKNGSFGLINPLGELTVPFEYDRFGISRNQIVASVDSTVSLFTLQGEHTKTLHNYTWVTPTSQGYVVEKNGKFGFLDEQLNEILPVNYDHIYFLTNSERREGFKQILSNRFLSLKLNEENGIFDLEKRRMIIPLTSDHIGAQWVTNCPNSDAIFHLSEQGKDIVKIVNSDGDLVVNHSHYPFTHYDLTPTDSCGTKSIQLAYIERNRMMKILNLKTGRYSNEHIEIFPLKGYSIYFDEKKWGVIDPDFLEFKSFSYPKYEEYTYEGIENSPHYSTAQNRYSTLFKYLEWTEKIDSVLITRTNIKKSKKNERDYDLFGLINFRIGKKIKTKYNDIIRRDLGDQTVYWASIYKDPHERYYDRTIVQLDIYDSDLNLIKQLENIEDIRFDHEREGKRNYNAVITKNGLKGVVDAFGNEVIPIKFDECQVQRIYKNQLFTELTIYYHCDVKLNPDNQFERLHGLFSEKGKVLIPMEYKQIYIQNNLIFATRRKDNHDIFKLNGDLFFEGAQFYGNAREVTKNGECIGKSYSDELKHTYIVKDDKLYHAFDGKLELYDNQSFDFPQKYCYFLEWILIDQNAKVITTDPIGISRRSRYYSNDFVTNCSTFFNEYPIPKKETPLPTRPAPASKIEKAPTHQWKLGPTKSQTEWFLYTPDGDLKYETAFDFPALAGGIFKQNGKLGRFDLDFNIDLKPAYDYIHYSGSFVKKGDLWFLRKGKTKEWSDGFDAISIKKWNDLRFVFFDGKIGLLDDSLNFSIPLTDSAAFVDKYDLVKILNVPSKKTETKTYVLNEIIFNGMPSTVYRKINNVHLIEEAFLSSTGNERLELHPVNKTYPDLPSELSYFSLKANEKQIFRERIPTFFNQYFFSEITYTRDQKYDGNYLEGRHYADKATFNYKIFNSQLIPIQLNDILKSDNKSTEQLNEMILRELTKIQAYGSNCMDIDSKIDVLKENFTLHESKIVYHGGVRGGFEISLYFKELQPLFRESKKMQIRY